MKVGTGLRLKMAEEEARGKSQEEKIQELLPLNEKVQAKHYRVAQSCKLQANLTQK